MTTNAVSILLSLFFLEGIWIFAFLCLMWAIAMIVAIPLRLFWARLQDIFSVGTKRIPNKPR